MQFVIKNDVCACVCDRSMFRKRGCQQRIDRINCHRCLQVFTTYEKKSTETEYTIDSTLCHAMLLRWSSFLHLRFISYRFSRERRLSTDACMHIESALHLCMREWMELKERNKEHCVTQYHNSKLTKSVRVTLQGNKRSLVFAATTGCFCIQLKTSFDIRKKKLLVLSLRQISVLRFLCFKSFVILDFFLDF